MNIALLKAACASGLLLVALSAISPPAGAVTPAGAWPVPGLGSPATVRAHAGGTASVSSSATYSDPIRSGGFQVGVASAPAIQTSGRFDWADASVGAGVTAGIGLFLAGGALMFGRRRVREQLRAS
jgi:hypothetical protein